MQLIIRQEFISANIKAQNIFSFLQPGENVNLQKRKFKIERKNDYNQLR